MTRMEIAFLAVLGTMKQGRCSYSLVRRDEVEATVGRLVEVGYVKRRRLGHDEGFQITDKGREYLGGVVE